jgi:hypothetical protein
MKKFLQSLGITLIALSAMQAKTLHGALDDMRGAACTPPTDGTVAIAIYLQPAPNFGYLALLRFCDSKSKLWFPLPMASNSIGGEVLKIFVTPKYPNGAAGLSRTPVSVSTITRNGLTLKEGVDYTWTTNVITFLSPIDPADSILAWYSY